MKPTTIDYAPVQYRRGGAVRRLAVVCGVLCLLFVLMGFRLAYADSVDHETAALIWFFLAVCTGGFATLIVVASWVVRGRV